MKQFGQVNVPAVLESVPPILDCVGETARAVGFDLHAIHQIQVAVDEACANVVEHAYCGMRQGEMQVTCCMNCQSLIIRVRDWGRSFLPDQVAVPNIEAPLEERELGGLGVYLIRKLMDEVQYTFDPERGNELVMVKHLTPEPSGP